jgi:hypothetical protein
MHTCATTAYAVYASEIWPIKAKSQVCEKHPGKIIIYAERLRQVENLGEKTDLGL